MVIKNALSIDLEDWYHPEFVRKFISTKVKSQINDSTEMVLELLDKYNLKATFFVLGDLAKKNPSLIKEIHERGHEIASHGMSHLPLKELNYNEFNNDILHFKDTINRILKMNTKIYGFRAPTFSINKETNFALKSLIKHNFLYDSSIVPTKLFYYGLSKAPKHIYRPNIDNPELIDDNSNIIEFPMTVYKIGKINIPISGGFFLRLFPYFIYKTLLYKTNELNRPFIIYFHPWEVYPKTYKIGKLGIIKYFITYYGIRNALKKVENLLIDFKFGTIKEVISENFLNSIKE